MTPRLRTVPYQICTNYTQYRDSPLLKFFKEAQHSNIIKYSRMPNIFFIISELKYFPNRHKLRTVPIC